MDSACMAHSVHILSKILGRLYEIIWDYTPVVGSLGGGGGAPKVPADNTHASCTSTHMRDPCMHVSPTHSTTLHTSYMRCKCDYMRFWEIPHLSVGGRQWGIGGSEAPITRETHPYSLIIYIFLIAFPSSMQYFQKRVFFLTNNV